VQSYLTGRSSSIAATRIMVGGKRTDWHINIRLALKISDGGGLGMPPPSGGGT
jgi:hypothetical protein